MPEPEMQTPGEPYLCLNCGRKPSEALTFYLQKDEYGRTSIEEARCTDACHTDYDLNVPAVKALQDDRNNLALQLAAMRACFNMIVNGLQQAFLSGFVEGRSGATDAEQAWMKSLFKKTAEEAVAQKEADEASQPSGA